MTDTAATLKKRTAVFLEGCLHNRSDVILILSPLYIIFNGTTLQSRKRQESVKILSNAFIYLSVMGAGTKPSILLSSSK